MFYDLSSDPHEDSNLSYLDLTYGWMLAPALSSSARFFLMGDTPPPVALGHDQS